VFEPLKPNRSVPGFPVIPVLVYPDVRAAVQWLTGAFGASERVRVGVGHRSQLAIGEGAVIVAEPGGGRIPPRDGEMTHITMVRIDDANAHCEHAREQGATIISEPTDSPFGERQYSARDPWGHNWTFTESIADVAPHEWGGEGEGWAS
jgi:uncharacterized glyoxalase superfamily protein PhnB